MVRFDASRSKAARARAASIFWAADSGEAPRGGSFDAVVEDGNDVVGVTEPPDSDEPRQEGIKVVVAGFGSAEFGGERAERFGSDGAVGFVCGEARSTDEGGPAVVLGG